MGEPMSAKAIRRWATSLIAAVVILGVGAGTTAGQATGGVNITDGQDISAYGFDPVSLQVNAGDSVTWTNTGSQAHTVTASDGSFDSGLIQPGDMFNLTFSTPGTYTYACTPHPWMKATIVVASGDA
jgi:plastocyanin